MEQVIRESIGQGGGYFESGSVLSSAATGGVGQMETKGFALSIKSAQVFAGLLLPGRRKTGPRKTNREKHQDVEVVFPLAGTSREESAGCRAQAVVMA